MFKDISNGFNKFIHDSYTLLLKEIIHLSQNKKNMSSVSRFMRNKGVFIKFHPDCCFEKNQAST